MTVAEVTNWPRELHFSVSKLMLLELADFFNHVGSFKKARSVTILYTLKKGVQANLTGNTIPEAKQTLATKVRNGFAQVITSRVKIWFLTSLTPLEKQSHLSTFKLGSGCLHSIQ